MLNELGKTLRKLRIDRGELLKEMADKLNISPSKLSMIENGKRKVPKDLVGNLCAVYALDDTAKKQLEHAAIMSNKEVILKLDALDNSDKDLAFAFARDFGALDPSDKDKLREIFGVGD